MTKYVIVRKHEKVEDSYLSLHGDRFRWLTSPYGSTHFPSKIEAERVLKTIITYKNYVNEFQPSFADYPGYIYKVEEL